MNSLEELSEQQVAKPWAEEAQRRDAQMDADSDSGFPAADIFREARSSK